MFVFNFFKVSYKIQIETKVECTGCLAQGQTISRLEDSIQLPIQTSYEENGQLKAKPLESLEVRS